ncbi:hypothetical protein FRC08_000159 [Ceratobasidium sp. 394]|nr:hypothetical protein FRC08_000159 [Ceratobasidium sp. 394]
MKFTSFAVTLIALPLAAWAAPTPNLGVEARQAGTLGSMCGGFAGFPCNKGLYCKLPEDKHMADAAGICVKKSKN